MRMNSPRVLLALAAVAVATAGCTGSDDAAPAAEEPAPAANPAPAITPPVGTAAPATSAAPTSTAAATTALPPVTPAPATTSLPPATTTPAATEAPPDGTVITIGDLFFRPSTITLSVGDTVVWRNDGSFPHTTTAGTPGNRTGSWHSGTLSNGETFSTTFEMAGTFQYFCTIHPNDMQATITVTNG